jgi:Trypsin-like peptidase domain
MNRWSSLGIGVVASVLSLVTAGTEATAQLANPAHTRARVEPSLVHLYFWEEGDANQKGSPLAGHGTGFVVTDPDNRRWIATTAHGFWTTDPKKMIVSVTYRLPWMTDSTPCLTQLIDKAHDVAMLSPNREFPLDDVPPLDWGTADPIDGDQLLVVGSPSGLEFRSEAGEAKNKPITVFQMARHQMVGLEAFAPMKADLTFIQHNILIAGGFSGSPVVSLRDGKVVGLQSSTLPDAAFVGFAIHRQHVRGFDWRIPPNNLEKPILVSVDTALAWKSAPAVPFKANPVAVPKPPKGEAPPPVKVKLGGIEVEAPFIHHGYVEPDARKVIEKYVEDKDWYLTEQFGGNRLTRLQDLLDRVPVARISNPLLGFQVLVPKGYRYSAQPTEQPNGLLVTFSPNKKVAAPYDWPLSIWVTVEPNLFTQARANFAKQLTLPDNSKLKITLTDDQTKSPAAFATFRDRMVNAMVADVVDPRFAYRDLGIRTQHVSDDPKKPPTFRGNPKSPIFTNLIAGEGRWLRSIYFSANDVEQLCHHVRLSGRDPRVFVVHYQSSKKNAIAFNTGQGAFDPIHAEYALIASTVSAR